MTHAVITYGEASTLLGIIGNRDARGLRYFGTYFGWTGAIDEDAGTLRTRLHGEVLTNVKVVWRGEPTIDPEEDYDGALAWVLEQPFLPLNLPYVDPT